MEMGYIPNFAATTLRKGSSKTVGILYDSLLNPFYSLITNYLWNELGPSGYSFVMLINDNPFLDEDIARRALSGGIDGIISFLEPTKEGLELCKKHGIPPVVVGRKTDLDVDCVVLDDVNGGRAAADHLYSKGYRHPMYIGESPELVCSKERANGFIQRFNELGVKAEALFDVNLSSDLNENSIAKLAKSENPPDSFFVFNDFLALKVLTSLRAVNANMAVIGFDNIQNEIPMNGRISTVGYDKLEFARLAVNNLLQLIAGTSTEKKITVLEDVYVVDGETT